jgi:hypothetical protein
MKITATTFTNKFKSVSPLRTLSRKRSRIKRGAKQMLRGKGGIIKGTQQSQSVPGGFGSARTGMFK